MYHLSIKKYRNDSLIAFKNCDFNFPELMYEPAIVYPHRPLVNQEIIPNNIRCALIPSGEYSAPQIVTSNLIRPNENHRLDFQPLLKNVASQIQTIDSTFSSLLVYELQVHKVDLLLVWNEVEDRLLLLQHQLGVITLSANEEVSRIELVGHLKANINIFDVLALVSHIIDLERLHGDQLLSADVNQDGEVNLFDVLSLVSHVIGLEKISTYRLVNASGEMVEAVNAINSPQYHLIAMGDMDPITSVDFLTGANSSILHGAFNFEIQENTETVVTAQLLDSTISAVPSYSLTGTDASAFVINNGVIKFVQAPDFEKAMDNDFNNRYHLTLEAVYEELTLSQPLQITVINQDESAVASPLVNAAVVTLLDEASGIERIDNLLMGSLWGSQLGEGLDLSYSFYDQDSVFSYDTDSLGVALGVNIKAIIHACFKALSELTNLNFSWLEETSSSVGDIRLGYQNGSSYGAAFGPAEWALDSYGGDVYFDSDSIADWDAASAGDFYYATVFHEIGHAMGLEHPHSEGTYGDLVLGVNTNTGSGGRDGQPYTLMSYASYQSGNIGYVNDVRAQTYMVDDIAALQYLYGANLSTGSGADVYGAELLTSDQPFEATIWDAGGIDLIDWRHGELASVIDLTPGSLSYFGGKVSSASDAGIAQMKAGEGVLGIAFDADIENVYGGLGADVLLGNDLSNVLYGGADSGQRDVLTGGAGEDYFVCNLLDASILQANVDRVTDFHDGEDKVALSGSLNYEDLTIVNSSTRDSSNVLIEHAKTGQYLLTLDNVEINQIDINDFINYEIV
jgi:Ca2+-binding RTX toxin-like protein